MAWSDRAEYEYACLNAAGIVYSVDEVAADRSVLQLRIHRIGGADVDLIATFPDLYPFFRPAVRLADGGDRFRHHLHPFSGDLCLLGRDTAAWSSGDTLAWLLTEQLPKTVRLGTLPDDPEDVETLAQLAEVEQAQAEPFSEYYTCFADNAMILVDGGWSLPAGMRGGTLDVSFGELRPQVSEGTLGAMLAITDDDGTPLGSLNGIDARRFPHAVRGRWVRLDEPVAEDSVEAIWNAARAASRSAPQPGWYPVDQSSGQEVQITAFVFPEERRHRRTGDGWLFIVRIRKPPPSARPAGRRRGHRTPPPGPTVAPWLVRAGYAGRGDLTERVPELAGLADRHVAVIGCGALGSTVAEQLARAGVGRLTLVDRDRLEPGNLVRHAAGLRHSGWSKARATADVAFDSGPHTEIVPHILSIGGGRHDATAPGLDRPEQDGLAELIDTADVVVDCTAEKGVQQALAWLCSKRDTQIVVASATNGGWGGRVSRFTPSPDRGCWSCLELALTDGTVPAAPAAPEDVGVQPVGCGEPTFTGSGFDIAEVALHAVRVVVGALQAAKIDGYPQMPHDVYLLALRDEHGNAIPPAWSTHPLTVHPACIAEHRHS